MKEEIEVWREKLLPWINYFLWICIFNLSNKKIEFFFTFQNHENQNLIMKVSE